MQELTQVNTGRYVTVAQDLFEWKELDIYEQMIGIILHMYTNETKRPSVSEIARKGRMTDRQAKVALQGLVLKKVLPHKVFTEILGDYGDDRLSWGAKGLLQYLKTNTNVTVFELVELVEQSGDSEEMIRTWLNELGIYGYLESLSIQVQDYDQNVYTA